MPNAPPQQFLGLPDILPDIYRSRSSLQVVKNHLETLDACLEENPENKSAIFLRNAFQQYLHCVSHLNNFHRQLFFDLHKSIEEEHPSLTIKTSARVKSVLRFYNKCRRHLLNGKQVYDISDVFAGRINIDSCDLTEAQLVDLCYEIANESIEFMLSKGFLPLPSSGVKNATGNFDPQKFPDIYVPCTSHLNPEYIASCKDYILCPKDKNGYQSLHIVFMSITGERFELQIRTFRMDDRAENFGAQKHDLYEELQDEGLPSLNLDRTKILMPFYSVRHGVVYDEAGLEKSTSLMLEIHRGGNAA